MRQLARWARVIPLDWLNDSPNYLLYDRRYLVAITFDDAFDSVLDNALPVLAKHGFHCTIFVPTGHLGRPPSWWMEKYTERGERVATAERLSRLPADLVTLGSHTVTHPHITSLPDEIARHELAQSMQDLMTLTGEPVRLFAFPYGDYDRNSIELCRGCGYERVFTIDPTPIVPTDGAYVCGRTDVSPTDGPLEFFLKATGSYRWMPTASAIKRKLKFFALLSGQ
jgi:peptidoglycan/xylan/chitin deacetylase (PgdA/CDA1 family)